LVSIEIPAEMWGPVSRASGYDRDPWKLNRLMRQIWGMWPIPPYVISKHPNDPFDIRIIDKAAQPLACHISIQMRADVIKNYTVWVSPDSNSIPVKNVQIAARLRKSSLFEHLLDGSRQRFYTWTVLPERAGP
jgi:hypothetical protein